MIPDQSENNSKPGKDKNFHLSNKAWDNPVARSTHSFKDCDWLSKKKEHLKRVFFSIIKNTHKHIYNTYTVLNKFIEPPVIIKRQNKYFRNMSKTFV